ncbi:hypothetical protein NPIL_258361 [Nephila pilipes]|uniref:Uncharacterized protein n=1 Tax=Nephila pilipes TaxID=299642 RepID=A0A8X6PJU4_NEPPI|nr:hypothetical protein NPIL_258361 [Nephila pilipes]
MEIVLDSRAEERRCWENVVNGRDGSVKGDLLSFEDKTWKYLNIEAAYEATRNRTVFEGETGGSHRELVNYRRDICSVRKGAINIL